MEIRPATERDAETIGFLLDQLGYPSAPEAVGPRLARLAEEPASSVLVAEEDGRVIGLAASHVIGHVEREERTCRLTALVVDERARGRGLGRALVDRVEADARRQGCDRVEVTLRPAREARHFYRQIGFEERPLRLMRYPPAWPGATSPDS